MKNMKKKINCIFIWTSAVMKENKTKELFVIICKKFNATALWLFLWLFLFLNKRNIQSGKQVRL